MFEEVDNPNAAFIVLFVAFPPKPKNVQLMIKSSFKVRLGIFNNPAKNGVVNKLVVLCRFPVKELFDVVNFPNSNSCFCQTAEDKSTLLSVDTTFKVRDEV